MTTATRIRIRTLIKDATATLFLCSCAAILVTLGYISSVYLHETYGTPGLILGVASTGAASTLLAWITDVLDLF